MSTSHIRTEAGAPGADSALFDDDRMGSLYYHMVAMAAAFGAPMLLMEWLSAKLGLSEVSAFAVGFMPLELMVMGALPRPIACSGCVVMLMGALPMPVASSGWVVRLIEGLAPA